MTTWVLLAPGPSASAEDAERVRAAGTSTDTTKMWLDGCISVGSDFDYEALSGATIYTRDCQDGGRLVSGTSVVPY